MLLITPIISQPVMFVIPGSILAILFHRYSKAKKGILKSKEIRLIIVMCLTGLILFIFFTMINSFSRFDYMSGYWEKGFLTFPPENLSHIRQYGAVLFTMLEHPFALSGNYQIFIALGALILGSLSISRRDNGYLILFYAPVIFLILASFLSLYPIGGEPTIVSGRLILFIHPFFSVIIGFGCSNSWLDRRIVYRIIGIACALVLIICPLSRIPEYTKVSRLNVRQAVVYLRENINHEDEIYTAGLIWSPVKYYFYRYDMGSFLSLGYDIPKRPAETEAWLLHYLEEAETAVNASRRLGNIENLIKIEEIGIIKIKPK